MCLFSLKFLHLQRILKSRKLHKPWSSIKFLDISYDSQVIFYFLSADSNLIGQIEKLLKQKFINQRSGTSCEKIIISFLYCMFSFNWPNWQFFDKAVFRSEVRNRFWRTEGILKCNWPNWETFAREVFRLEVSYRLWRNDLICD